MIPYYYSGLTVHHIYGATMKFFHLSLFLVVCLLNLCFGYDEYEDSLPNQAERAVLVLTNACRMAPVAFRDEFIGNNGILLPQNYPAVPPLYRNTALNKAARDYSERMATECGLTHECGGESFQSRFESIYGKSGFFGENIASGYQTPLQVIVGWLIDGPSADEAAADKSNADGHRSNIMDQRFKEIGCGYYLTGSGRSAKPYWCQDFGSRTNAASYHPVPAASHFFFSSGKVTFLTNIYDTTSSVETVTLLFEDNRTPMEPFLGSNFKGTYVVTLDEAADCRYYRIEVAYENGSVMYYPEFGWLPTTGEGSCTIEKPEQSTQQISRPFKKVSEVSTIQIPNGFSFRNTTSPSEPIHTSIFTCNGRLLHRLTWSDHSPVLTFTHTSPSILIVSHRHPDGTISSERVLCR